MPFYISQGNKYLMLSLIEPSGLAGGPRSQTSFAYARLRRDVLAGRYAPGERLKIADLAAALEVSPGAVREAVARLGPEPRVVSRDQKGFVVAPLSIEDLEDLTNLRCRLEAIALRDSVVRGDSAWESHVLAAAHRLRRSRMLLEADKTLNPEWVEHHAAFHATLVSACGSPRLLGMLAQLYQQSERYRGLSVYAGASRDTESEHQGLVDAALDRKADELVDLMEAHLRRTTDLIVTAARASALRLA